MKRGAIVVVSAKGAYLGKPRPALVVQSDLFNPTHGSLTVCPITSDCVDAPLFRVTLPPGGRTGLKVVSQIMIDKVVSVPRPAITTEIGHCNAAELDAIDEGLRRWFALE